MLTRPGRPRYTPEEYLNLEETSKEKHESFQGEIFRMAGGSTSHNRITFNLSGQVYLKLNGGNCEGFNSDMRLLVQANGLYTYPDLMVVCGPLEYAASRTDTITNPTVVIEVLSSSTAEYDRTDGCTGKFDLYKSLVTLQNYVLVDQHRPYIQCFSRVLAEPRIWTVETYRQPDESLNLPALGFSLDLIEIYSRVEWPKIPNEHPNPTE